MTQAAIALGSDDYRKPDFMASAFGLPPLMTREAFAAAIGLEPGVVIAQCDRGLWPTIKVGKRVLINVEAVRIKAAERAAEFSL